VKAKKDPSACDARASKVIRTCSASNSAFAFQSQHTIDALRVRRLMRAGLPIGLAAVVAPLAFGEGRHV